MDLLVWFKLKVNLLRNLMVFGRLSCYLLTPTELKIFLLYHCDLILPNSRWHWWLNTNFSDSQILNMCLEMVNVVANSCWSLCYDYYQSTIIWHALNKFINIGHCQGYSITAGNLTAILVLLFLNCFWRSRMSMAHGWKNQSNSIVEITIQAVFLQIFSVV